MGDITAARDGVGSTITVRLDGRTDQKLAALVEYFTEQDALGRSASVSQVVRGAIDVLYAQHLRLPD